MKSSRTSLASHRASETSPLSTTLRGPAQQTALRQMPGVSDVLYLRDYKIANFNATYSGPARYDPGSNLILPHGFGQINFNNSPQITWTQLTVKVLPNKSLILLNTGLRYDLSTEHLPDNRLKTQLRMATYSPEGVLQENLTLAYEYSPGAWHSAQLVDCKLSQPDYEKTKAGCSLLQALHDPLDYTDVHLFFKWRKNVLIAYRGAIYFVNHRYRSVKRIQRDELNATTYDELLSVIGDYSSKEPTKKELNQGYYQSSFHENATLDLSRKIIGLTGDVLTESPLDDGEGMFFDANEKTHWRIMTGYMYDSAPPTAVVPYRDYFMMLNVTDHTVFYHGVAGVLPDRKLLMHGPGWLTTTTVIQSTITVQSYQGYLEKGLKVGQGIEYTRIIEENEKGTQLSELREESGCWRNGEKDGLFHLIINDITFHERKFLAGRRAPYPFMYEAQDLLTIAIFDSTTVSSGRAYEIQFLISSTDVPMCFFKELIDEKERSPMPLNAFFQAISLCPHVDVFWRLLLKHVSLYDLELLQTILRTEGYHALANQFFLKAGGAFRLTTLADSNRIENHAHHRNARIALMVDDEMICSSYQVSTKFIQIHCIGFSNASLIAYLEIAESYLRPLDTDSVLLNAALSLKQCYLDTSFCDYANVLNYFDELKPQWSEILNKHKSASHQEKRQLFIALINELATPWIFRRLQLIYRSILLEKLTHGTPLTTMEDTVAEMLIQIERDYSKIQLQSVCAVVESEEERYRYHVKQFERLHLDCLQSFFTLVESECNAQHRFVLSVWQVFFENVQAEWLIKARCIQAEYQSMQHALVLLKNFSDKERQARRKLFDSEMTAIDELCKANDTSLQQMRQSILDTEQAERRQLCVDQLQSHTAMMSDWSTTSSALIARLHQFNFARDFVAQFERECLQVMKLQNQLAFALRRVGQLPFNKPFDTYIVGSAVANKVLGREWREGQDIDIMAVPHDLSQVLEMSDYSALQWGVRRSRFVKSLFTWCIDVPDAGLRRVDLMLSSSHPKEDYLTRDFTVGAIYESSRGEVIDPTQRGLSDLKAKQLVTILPALQSFQTDPIRMIRAIKYVVNGYTLSTEIIHALKTWSSPISETQRARIYALVRHHLQDLDKGLYTAALLTYGLTQSLFGIPEHVDEHEALQHLIRLVNPSPSELPQRFFSRNVVSASALEPFQLSWRL